MKENFMEKTEYVECYIAFLDMLGFKNLINDKNKTCNDIARIFESFIHKKPLKALYRGEKNIIDESATDALKMKVMSDSICF